MFIPLLFWFKFSRPRVPYARLAGALGGGGAYLQCSYRLTTGRGYKKPLGTLSQRVF